MLKGFIAYGKYSFLTLILDQNNLDFQEIDGFFFGNSNAVRNKIKEDKICIIIVNNNGIFKQGYAEILKQKLQDKIVIDKKQGLIYTQTSQLKERQEDLVNERVRNFLQVNFRKGVENDDQESIESLNYLFPNNKISFVEKINLSDIQINNLEIAKSLFTNIFKNRGLKSFIMQNMNTVTFEALCDVFYKQENINLNKIDLSGSDLSTKDIYKFFKNLSVNKLILRNTKLNNKSLQALENSLKKNKSFKKSLRMIDLSNNPLVDNYSHLGRVVQQFKFLKILNLKQMNGLMQKKFYQIFQKHASGRKKNQNIFENLHEINFQNNKNMQPEGLVSLIRELEKFVNLEKLILSQCDLGDEYIKQWGKNQKIFQIIKKIDISENNRIGPLGWGHFFEILGDSQRIEKIKMQSCALSQESLSKITEKIFYIKKRSKFAQNLVTNLKCLDFRRNNYQQQLMIQSQNMINSNNQININNNNINNKQLNQSNNGGNLAKIEIVQKSLNWQEFMKIISTKTKIKQVKLQGCYFSNEAISYQGFFNFSQGSNLGINLQKLDFSYCVNLGARQWNEIFQNIFFLKNLKELILEFCNLDDQKVDCILNHNIEKNTNQNNSFMGQSRDDQINFDRNITQTLEKLSLKGNQMIYSQGYSKIFQFLVLCKNFKKLYLSENGLTWTKIKGINVQILQKNPAFLENLQILKFCRNKNLEPNGWSHLFEIFKGVKNLNELRISDCRFTDEKFHRIKQGILGLNCTQSLRTIDFFGNGLLSKTSWSIFFKDIVFRHDNLENLYIGCCNLNGNIIENVCEKIKDEIRLFYEQVRKEMAFPQHQKSQQQIQIQQNSLQQQYQMLQMNSIYSQQYNTQNNGSILNNLDKNQNLKEINLQITSQSNQNMINNGNNIPIKTESEQYSKHQLIKQKSMDQQNLLQKNNEYQQQFQQVDFYEIIDKYVFRKLRKFHLNQNSSIGQEQLEQFFNIITRNRVEKNYNFSQEKAFYERYSNQFKKILGKESQKIFRVDSLILDGNIRFKPSQWHQLFSNLVYFDNLRAISLGKCYLDIQKIEQIISAVEEFENMEIDESSDQKIISKNGKPKKVKKQRGNSSVKSVIYCKSFYKNIKHFNFSGNKYINQEGWKKLFQFLEKFQNLQVLQLNNCDLDDQVVKFFADSLKKSKDLRSSLTQIEFGSNQKVTQKGWVYLFKSFKKCTFLENLNLSNCNLDYQCMQAFCDIFEVGTSMIEKVNINCNINIEKKGFDIFFERICKINGITKIDLSMTKLNDSKIQELLIGLKNQLPITQSLNSLMLMGNHKISNEGWESLFQGINNCDNFQQLQLQVCKLTGSIIKRLIRNSQKLKQNLRHFNILGNPDIKRNHMADLIMYLFEFKRLEYLNLGMCDLDTDLVVDLEQKLYIIKNNKKEVKSNLKTLELIGNNRISSFGWEKLFNLIVNQMPKIQKIGLRKCELNDEDLAKIVSEWKNRPPICKSIKQIFLQNNPDISVQGYVDFIKNGIKYCQSIDYLDLNLEIFKQNKEIMKQIKPLLLKDNYKKQKFLHQKSLFLSMEGKKIMTNRMDRKQFLQQNTKNYNKQLSFNQNQNLIIGDKYEFEVVESLPKQLGNQIYMLNKYFSTKEKLTLKPDILTNSNAFKHIGIVDLKFFCHDFLYIYCEKNQEIALSTNCLQFLSQIFCYYFPDYELQGPFPYKLLFNDFTYDKFPKMIQKLVIIDNMHKRQHENINKYFIKQLYDKFKNQQNIKQIYLDYTFTDQIMSYLLEKSNEEELVEILLLFPPKQIQITQPLTLNTWKAIYTIGFDSYNLDSVWMQYDATSSLNIGFAYSLREKLYFNWQPNNGFLKVIKLILYKFLSIFIVKGQNQRYRYDKDIQGFNEQLKNQKRMFFSLFFFILFYNIVLIGILIYESDWFSYDLCIDSAQKLMPAHYVYIFFAFFTGVVECILFRNMVKKFGHYLPNIIDEEEFYYGVKYESKTVFSKLKQKIQENKWVTYLFQFIVSQIDRYDFYSDIQFILISYSCKYYLIANLALIFKGLSFIFFFSRSFSAFYRRIKNSERRISTQYINDFYCLCSHIEFNAVADVLDFIAPYNVVVIPNNCITRIILPQFYGKAINNKVLVSILTFIFEDIPQLLLGLAFIFENEQKYTFNVISVIVMSIISLIIAFYNFMSIRPSILNQMDFDELIKKKKEDYNQNVQQYLSMEQKLMNYWIDYHLSDRKSYNIESEMLDEQVLNLEVDNKFQPQRQTGHRQTEIQQQQMFKIDNLNVKANSKNNDINDIDSSPYKSKSFIYQQVNDGKILNQSSQVLQK